MPVKPRVTPTGAKREETTAAVITELKRLGSRGGREGLARYGLPTAKALGVPMNRIQQLARKLGRDQELAEALWATDIYEARLLVAYVGEPDKLTPALMNRWCRDFDNWGVVDTVCFKLFDQSPHAWKLIVPWARMQGEFQRRAGYVLLACLAGHDRVAPDAKFLRLLPLVERGASDERNFVKKGVSWALRRMGRRSLGLNRAIVELARRLVEAETPAARWVGRDTLKELTSPAVRKLLAGNVSTTTLGGCFPERHTPPCGHPSC